MSSSHDLVDRGNADANWSTNNQKKQKIVGTEQLSVSVSERSGADTRTRADGPFCQLYSQRRSPQVAWTAS
ncbi:[Pyruvate dehydrogenase (acetyl-transferring)] kinase [Trichinella pseudospiralis]